MATDPMSTQSPAALLEHAHDKAHNPTVEEIVDETEIQNAGSALKNGTQEPDGQAGPSTTAADKKAPKQGTPKAPVLDVRSEELFPALGGGPKPRAPAAVPMAWGARKPQAAGAGASAPQSNGPSNGVSNGTPGPALPQASAPGPGAPTGAPRIMTMPGKHVERIRFAPSQMLSKGQLKKPIRDILRDISKRSKATVDMHNGPGDSLIFEGKGSVDSVRQALKEVAQQVGSKQSVKVPIPASARPHIIGRQGSVVQGIHQRTGARIQIPRPEEVGVIDEDDDSVTIDVLIEGDAVAAEMARREIEAIVKDRVSSMNLRLKTIPPEFFPFIAGAHDANLNDIENRTKAQVRVPRYDTWSQQPPPQEAGLGQIQFVPHADRHIIISGERAAAQEARAEIERRAEQLRQEITLRQLAINRGQHQFILGEGANSLHDFLAETGCAIVLPPESDDTEFLTITGPPSQIEMGMNRAMDLASSMAVASIDLSRQHPSAPNGPHAHARALTSYLQQRQIIKELERRHDSRIVVPSPSDGPITWEVYSRDGKNTIRARSDIMGLIQAYPPQRLRSVPVDPFYHSFLRTRSGPQLKTNHGVHLIVPDDIDNGNVTLVFEGPSGSAAPSELPRQRPTQAEITAFEKTLKEAQESLLSTIGNQQNIVAGSASVPNKYQEKVRKFINREQQSRGEDYIPVRVIVGEPNAENGTASPSPNNRACEVSLRGPSHEVDDLTAKILSFVVEQEQDDKERGYTISFDFPQKFANFLIGRKGENINKLRDEFDVDIKVENGKVEVKGPKAKADAAKARIISMGKRLEDEATYVLKIPGQYHRDLIGQKGAQVNRLQDRYNVRVQFPRAVVPISDDVSVGENASEAGGPRYNRPQQAADEVIVKGPRKGADGAREEILSLYQWVVDHSHSASVSVAQSQVPSLIGAQGREMDRLRADTGAQIDVPGANDPADAAGRVEIRVKGTKKQVEDAKKLLQQRAKQFDATVTKTIEVDKKHHKALIGGGGANIRRIVIDAGGPDDGSAARMVKFPRPESTETAIRLEGDGAVVAKIVAAIEEFVKRKDDEVTEFVEVPTSHHRLLVGRGGDTRRNLETQFNVSIDIPKQGSGQSNVKVRGPSSAVNEAKEHILGMIKQQEGETVQVPRHLHHTITENGSFFRRLRNDHQVTVDHAGQQTPPRPSTTDSRNAAGEGASSLPLITDDPSVAEDSHSWKIVDTTPEPSSTTDESATIPWVLSGKTENVAKAKAILAKAIEAASTQSATGYLILPDPKTYRFVIGPGGSQINSIREKTGCKINVPKDQAKGEAIELKGSREGLEEAKEMILEAVKAGGNAGGRRRS
ncbi:hypothetical protein FQN54_001537 [Arachnomyces sp. PD_36]|nr:hypothetical protein FQN54_001537 [Arachnomyces sp. PD_36]